MVFDVELRWVIRNVILVVVFGRVEGFEGFECCYDFAFKDFFFIELIDVLFCNMFLLRVFVEDCRAVLCADIIALAVECGGVMSDVEEYFDSYYDLSL